MRVWTGEPVWAGKGTESCIRRGRGIQRWNVLLCFAKSLYVVFVSAGRRVQCRKSVC